MGGTPINEKEETAIPGLFAAGEASGGIQGGGRMQGTAFLETQVFGIQAGKNAAILAMCNKTQEINFSQIREEERRLSNIQGIFNPTEIIQIFKK